MASKPSPLQELMQELLAPGRPEGSEDVKARLLFQFSSSLLDESSKLSGRISNLAIDLKRIRGELELVKGVLTRIQDFIDRSDLSNANPRRRRVYVEELASLLEMYAEQVEKLVQAIYNDAKQSEEGWSGIEVLKAGLHAIFLVGSAIGVVYNRNVTSILVTIGTGVHTAYQAYTSWTSRSSSRSVIDELLTDAERFRKEMAQLRIELKLQSIQLKGDEAAGEHE